MMCQGRKRWPAALILLAAATLAQAHWLKPEEIIAGLKQNPALHQRVGITEVHSDPKLDRLLIIKVRRDVWERVPATDRLALAADWFDTWHHNVDDGIVGILDADTDESLVSFDALGRPGLKEKKTGGSGP